MKTKLALLAMLLGGSLFAGPRVVVGIGVGGYYAPPPVPVVRYIPPSPGPGYAWVGGYWSPVGARYAWREGYWARRPYVGAYWVAPRYSGHTYYRGYWRR